VSGQPEQHPGLPLLEELAAGRRGAAEGDSARPGDHRRLAHLPEELGLPREHLLLRRDQEEAVRGVEAVRPGEQVHHPADEVRAEGEVHPQDPDRLRDRREVQAQQGHPEQDSKGTGELPGGEARFGF